MEKETQEFKDNIMSMISNAKKTIDETAADSKMEIIN